MVEAGEIVRERVDAMMCGFMELASCDKFISCRRIGLTHFLMCQ